jgi:hypothetical protein
VNEQSHHKRLARHCGINICRMGGTKCHYGESQKYSKGKFKNGDNANQDIVGARSLGSSWRWGSNVGRLGPAQQIP